jgi:dTDP-D-glucose 4,6-dehydratase
VLDGEKGESLLKMKDFKSFEDGMRKTIDFYISITKS